MTYLGRPGVRTCKRCGTTEGPFVKNEWLCRACRNAIGREYREQRGDIYNAIRRDRRIRSKWPRSVLLRDHPDAQWRKVYGRALSRAYRAGRSRQHAVVARRYYERNKHIWQKSNAQWQAANRDKLQLYAENRRARKRLGTAPRLTTAQWREVLTAYGRKCVYCGSVENITIDHETPLAHGGEHTQDNIVPACLRCNTSKKARTPLEWFLAIGVPIRRQEAA